MPEFELKNIITKGRKEVPQGTILMVRRGRPPGTVTIGVRLPGQAASKVYPELEICGGKVELPVNLAFLSHAKEDAEFVRSLANTNGHWR